MITVDSETVHFGCLYECIVTDRTDAFCCENATREVQEAGRAVSVIRTPQSELMEGLKWDTPEVLCVVNSSRCLPWLR